MAENELDFRITTDIPHFDFTGELWDVYCEDLWENLPRYNVTALYYGKHCITLFINKCFATGDCNSWITSGDLAYDNEVPWGRLVSCSARNHYLNQWWPTWLIHIDGLVPNWLIHIGGLVPNWLIHIDDLVPNWLIHIDGLVPNWLIHIDGLVPDWLIHIDGLVPDWLIHIDGLVPDWLIHIDGLIPDWLIHIDGLVQDCSNSIASTLELLRSCTKPSIYPSPGLDTTANIGLLLYFIEGIYLHHLFCDSCA